jgi:GNAT superfamily N-acetyltransferase
VDVQVIRYSDRPELWADMQALSAGVWPEYNQQGDVLNTYWSRLYDEFAPWQFVLLDADTQQILAEGHTIPVAWDGTDDGLGPGIDAAITRGFDLAAAGGTPDTLCALAAEIFPANQGRGLSRELLGGMAALGRAAGFGHLIAPARPSLKFRYPTIPIERYVSWTRPEGDPFDPWIRVHARMGARIGPALPTSMRITGSVADWESWTGMAFPATGEYWFPDGLATLQIDRERDTGEYWEPNVWLIHPIAG